MLKSEFTLIAIVLILLLVVVGCKANLSRSGEVDVSIDDALKMWQNKEAVIIDIRTPEEYKDGHIPGVALIPLDQLDTRMNEVPKDKKVLIICRSGNRSAKGTSLLRKNGFDNVYNVTGGMLAWRGPQEK